MRLMQIRESSEKFDIIKAIMDIRIIKQLGNLASELSRAYVWEKKNDKSSRDQALIRALGILDTTISETKEKNQLKELTKLHEIIGDRLELNHGFDISTAQIRDFCLNFAILARKK